MKIYTVWTTQGDYYGLAVSLTHAGKLIAAKTGITPKPSHLTEAIQGARRGPQTGITLIEHTHPDESPITADTLRRVKEEGSKELRRDKKR